ATTARGSITVHRPTFTAAIARITALTITREPAITPQSTIIAAGRPASSVLQGSSIGRPMPSAVRNTAVGGAGSTAAAASTGSGPASPARLRRSIAQNAEQTLGA